MNQPCRPLAKALLLALIVLPGCGGYEKVSLLAYEQAKSLYGVCNRKNAELLEKVAEQISQARQSGELPPEEADLLEAIIDEARGGEWASAAENCRRLMEAQAER